MATSYVSPKLKMVKMFSNNLFAALLLAAIVLSDVKSLPTSVLVDSKQQTTIGANINRGNYVINHIFDGFI